jgi:hypothetical protein
MKFRRESDPIVKPCDQCGFQVEYFTEGQFNDGYFRCHACLLLQSYIYRNRFLWERMDGLLKLDLQMDEYWEDFSEGRAA